MAVGWKVCVTVVIVILSWQPEAKACAQEAAAQEAVGQAAVGQKVTKQTESRNKPASLTGATRGSLKAGAYARNIDPVSFPVWVSGGIVAAKGERVIDSLFARSLVIEQGGNAIAVCVVDSLAVPASIVLRAKAIVSEQIGIPSDRILISATHAHSAPCVMGAHGTPVQEDYAEQLPGWIAESIVNAYARRVDAQVGYAVTNADRYIYCRHWIMEPGHAGGVLFSGRDGNIAMMNPGHENPFKIRQTAEVDRSIPVLSVQTIDGRPLSVLASFCTHYAGAPALSSDYFGVVAQELERTLSRDTSAPFVGIMANGTSGDANCIDFSRPAQPFNHREVGKYVAQRILDLIPAMTYQSNVTVDGQLENITVNARVADAEELQQAEAYVATKMRGRSPSDNPLPSNDPLPSNIEENYARETVLLSKMPRTRDLPLQALRIGDMVIAGYPNETFNATGFAVRARSPFAVTMNIGLANEYAGYLPPADQFPLGGYTSWRARTSCLEERAEAMVVEGVNRCVQSLAAKHFLGWAHANALTDKNDGPGDELVRSTPSTAVSPTESLNHFVVDPLQRIELAATEPNEIAPVAIRFDDRGDLWVVEMRDYPNPIDPTKPTGRIRVLRDENLDGIFEADRLFADGLLMPTGLQFHRDGVLVTVGGELWFLRDTDGDGRSDDQSTWLQGFAAENPQLRVNDPDFGIDTKLYLANGLRSSRIASGDQTVSIGGSDVRYDVRTGKAEAITGPSQFGMSWDRFGNRYFCSNRNPCDTVLLESDFAARSLLVGLAPMTESVLPAGERSTVHPLVNAWTTSNLHAGQFTAACGLLISDSRHLPLASLGNALTCEPTGSLVHRVGLGRIRGKTIAEEPARDHEWLASRDPWFRPVNLEEGPEGGIYVVDMHRAVIEHPDWVPDELKHRVDARWGDDSGRIYRVVRHDAPRIDPIFQQLRDRPLRGRSSSELVDALNHPNEWVRKNAARILNERDEPEVESLLLKYCRRNIHSPGFLRGIYLLQSRGAWDRGLIELYTTWLDDPKSSEEAIADPALRAALWRASPSPDLGTLGLYASAWGAIADGTAEELIACVQSAPVLSDASKLDREFLAPFVERASASADDPHVLLAISAVVRENLVRFTGEFLDAAQTKLDQKKMVVNIAWPAIRKWVSLIARPDDTAWIQIRDKWYSEAMKRLALEGMPSEADRRMIVEPQLRLALAVAVGIASSSDRAWLAKHSEFWDRWISVLHRSEISEPLKSEILELLSQSVSPEQSMQCATALADWTSRTTEPSMLRRSLSAWAKHADPSITVWILDRWDGATPTLRSEMFQALRGRPERMAAWLDRVEQGGASLNTLDATQLQSLRQIEGELQPRIHKLLEGRTNTNRQQVIDRYAVALSQSDLASVDMVRGKQLFSQHCAACHRVDGVGSAVGPDISDSRTQLPMQLLVSILDPNRAIDNNYFRITVRMTDGAIHDGIVVEESSQHLTLRNQNNPAMVLSKPEIDTIKSSGVSLMPEGIEAQIDETLMVDLIGYIKNWRYVGGEAPGLNTSGAPPQK